jgi:hypothetical protein
VYGTEIFRVGAPFSVLSIAKFSDLYITLIKSYESPKFPKMVIFSYIWSFIKFEWFSVRR